MKYLVRYVKNGEVINDLATDNETLAFKRESELAKIYGRKKVWVVDAIMEILCG